jgi:hypothetical protein
MFEHRADPILPRRLFIRRMGRHGLLALLIVSGSLTCGVLEHRDPDELAIRRCIHGSALRRAAAECRFSRASVVVTSCSRISSCNLLSFTCNANYRERTRYS